MFKRHIEVRLVKKTDEPETAAQPTELPFLEIQEVVHQIFIGIGALMLVNAFGKILVNKLS